MLEKRGEFDRYLNLIPTDFDTNTDLMIQSMKEIPILREKF